MPTTRTFLRRFVYLLVEGQRRLGSEDLHRINMSRFFFNPRSPPPPPTTAMGTEFTADARRLRLPRRPTMTFYAPSSEICTGRLNFMLAGRDRVLATDQTGGAAVYDAGLHHAMRTAPSFSKPTHHPVSVSVGNTLYVLDSVGWVNRFDAIVFDGGGNGGDGRDSIESLPPPPYQSSHVAAVAVVPGGTGPEIWVSTDDEDDQGTYAFAIDSDSDGGGGEWRKQGDWKLPFSGQAEYVPEYKLWFGLSSKKGSNLLCAYNLAAAGGGGGGAARRRSPPAARNVWEDLRPPREWEPFSSYLVHLGSGRFCIARMFFSDTSRKPCHVHCCVYQRSTVLAVFTAVEVVPYSRRGLRMIKHRSECYDLGEILLQKVL